jgi:hypothetical protein
VGQEHQILVCLQLSGRAGRLGKQLGKGEEGALALVGRELDDFATALDEAGVVVEGALTPGLYRAAVRNAYDPFTRSHRSNEELEGQPWPIMARTEIGRYYTDGAVHATYWVSGPPGCRSTPRSCSRCRRRRSMGNNGTKSHYKSVRCARRWLISQACREKGGAEDLRLRIFGTP